MVGKSLGKEDPSLCKVDTWGVPISQAKAMTALSLTMKGFSDSMTADRWPSMAIPRYLRIVHGAAPRALRIDAGSRRVRRERAEWLKTHDIGINVTSREAACVKIRSGNQEHVVCVRSLHETLHGVLLRSQ